MRTALFYPVLVVSTFVFSTLAVLGGAVGAGAGLFDWIHRSWGRVLLRAAGVRLEVEGLEHVARDSGQIIVANHQSYFDIWALFAALPVSLRFVAKRELSRIPILASAMRRAGHVFIDRDRASSAGEAIRAAGERVRDEALTLVLFPEGTRSRDGELGRFLRGSFALAIEMQVPLVPTAISGGRGVFPPGSRRVRSGTMTIRLAPPISLEGMDTAGRGTLMEETRGTIAALLGSDRGGTPA